jgi:Pyruvate/2-oxoacid:ferredoxin oxidoreductase gamma subunit
LTGFLEGEDKQDFDLAFEEAIIKTFKDKQDVIDLNLTAFRQGKKAVKVESVGLKEI